MKCFYHTDVDAVAQCVDCGKFLCKDCASKYKPVLCDECYQTRVNDRNLNLVSEAKQVIKVYVKGVVFGLAIAFIVTGIIYSVVAQDSGDLVGLMNLLNILRIILFFIGFGLFSRNSLEYLSDSFDNGGGLLVNFLRGIRFFTWMPKVFKAIKIVSENK